MKKTWKRALALLLVLLMGMTSFGGFGMSAYAQEVVPVTASLNFETLTLVKGQTVSLSFFVVYSDYTLKQIESGVTWSSGDSTTVFFNADGIVTAVKATKKDQPVTITASCTVDGVEMQASCKVTVIGSTLPVTGVQWDFINETRTPWFRYYDGDSDQAAVYYFMPTASHPDVAWKIKIPPFESQEDVRAIFEHCDVTFNSSDKRVIVIDEETGRIIPVGNGTSDLTVQISLPDGRLFRDTVTAGVYGSPYTPITYAAVTYDEELSCTVAEGKMPMISVQTEDEYTLSAALNEKATLNNTEITVDLGGGRTLKTAEKCTYTWTSDNDAIVTVDTNADGTATLTAVSYGETVVTLTVNDNGEMITAAVRVKVWDPLWKVIFKVILYLITFRWNRIPPLRRSYYSGDRCGIGSFTDLPVF